MPSYDNQQNAGDPFVPDDPMPVTDRFDPRTTNARRTEMSYNFEEHQGFAPSSLEFEKVTGGWLRTTMPEGLPLSELHEVYSVGSRGAESHLMKPTAARATRRGKRGYIDSRPTHGGTSLEGGDWDNAGDGGDDDGT